MENKKLAYFLSFALLVAGLILIYSGVNRPVTILVDEIVYQIDSRALTVGGALRNFGSPLSPGDQITPGVNQLIGWSPVIRIQSPSRIQIWSGNEGLSEPFYSTQRIPGNLLLEAGLRLFPGDSILWNGESIHPDTTIPDNQNIVLQFNPAVKIQLVQEDTTDSFYSSAATIAQALGENGYILSQFDEVYPPLNNPITGSLIVEIKRAKPVLIQTINGDYASKTNQEKVGEALAEAGLALQGQDYTIPSENLAVPEDGIIQLVRVEDEILVEQTPLPFQTEYVQDADLELDQQRVIEYGQVGLKVIRTRIIYENGEEVSRFVEKERTAREPVNEQVGIGTKIGSNFLDTPEGSLEYYRAVPVYATSYSPCRSGVDRCLYGTSSGLPVQQGVIGVTLRWYRLLAGHEVYIPGYGRAVIGDVGGGIPGRYWIDLGYTDEDYVGWAQNTTLYFLTPAPANVPWILP